jgi:hypothetical protein
MEFTIGDVVKNPENGEKFVTITISNTDIRIIKSSVEAYQGDKDDVNYQVKMEKVRDNIHQTWKVLNPS